MSLNRTIRDMAADDFFLAARSDVSSLNNLKTRRGTDPTKAVKSVADVFCPHEIVLHRPDQMIDFRHSSASFGSVSFNQITYGDEVDIVVRQKGRSQYIFLLPLRGEMLVESAAGRRTLGVGSYMLMGPDAAYRFVHNDEDSHLAFSISRHRVESSGIAPHSLANGIDSTPLDDAAGTVADYATFLCRELNAGGDLFAAPSVQESAETMLVALLQRMQIEGAQTLTSSAASPSFVLRAERFMEQRLGDDLTVEEVAAAAGVAPRTLYAAFTQFRGLAPMKWLRMRRLHSAREAIMAAAGNGPVNILHIANACGMQHGGRFAAYYQRQFQESPSDTARRVRYLPLPDPAVFGAPTAITEFSGEKRTALPKLDLDQSDVSLSSDNNIGSASKSPRLIDDLARFRGLY